MWLRFAHTGMVLLSLTMAATVSASIELVSRTNGAPSIDSRPDRGSESWASSTPDGLLIAVASQATNLSPDDTNNHTDIYVYNRESNTAELITAGGNMSSGWPALSASGRFVAFHSSADNLAPGDTNNEVDVLLHDRETGVTKLLTPSADGRSVFPVISANGQSVAFETSATNLVPGDTNGTDDVLVYDQPSESLRYITAGANGRSFRPSLSGDGRYVAFQSLASNLVTGDLNGQSDIFVHDRDSGLMERLTPGANSASSWPSITDDGRFVVFESSANNLVVGDTNGNKDIFIHDRETSTTELITAGADRSSADPRISADGRFITFQSTARNLIPNRVVSGSNIFVYDRTNQTFEVITEGSNGLNFRPAVSIDGRYITFATSSTNLVPIRFNDDFNILSYDRTAEEFTRIPSMGAPFEVAGGSGDSTSPSVGGKGRFIAYQSFANNLTPDSFSGHTNIYVYDKQTKSNTLITPGSNMGSRHPSISDNGRFVAFESSATNLVPNDNNARLDIFVFDRETSTTESLSAGGNEDSFHPSISKDGRFVAFESKADNLVAGDSNGSIRDIFVYDRDTQSIELITPGGNSDSKTPSISGNGRFVAFSSEANNLVGNDSTPSISDIYLFDRVTGVMELLTPGADNWSLEPVISADGRYIAFSSDAANLTSGDTNGSTYRDIYIHDRNSSTTKLLTPGADRGSFGPSISETGRFIAFNSDSGSLVAGEQSFPRDVYLYDQEAGTTRSITLDANSTSDAASIDPGGGTIAFQSLATNLANDGTGILSDIFAATINEAPSAEPLTIATSEDASVSITVNGFDADEDNLTFEVAESPVNGVVSGNAPNLVYTPDSNFFGVDSFTFIASDGITASSPATVSITVASVNDAPVATGPTQYTTNEDTPLAIALDGFDIEGSSVAFAITSSPRSGVLIGTAPNLIYSPADDFNGSDEFSFAVSDGELQSEARSIILQIVPVNDTPQAIPASFRTTTDLPVAISISGIDADNNSLSYSIATLPIGGNLSGSLPDLLYTPNGLFTGLDSFAFTVSDGIASSAEAQILIEVSNAAPPPPVNNEPTADSQAVTTLLNTAVSILLGGSDADADELEFDLISLPSNGSLSGSLPDLVYAPDTDFAGVDSIVFSVSDGTDSSEPATVSIKVADARISLLAAVLPTSRSVEVGSTATAFATLINGGSVGAVSCELHLPEDLNADFFFQASDENNAPVGERNVPMNVSAGGSQSFVFGITPNEELSATQIALSYQCANANNASSITGLNTLLLSASESPVPDLVALAATSTADGVMTLNANSGFFTAATVNVGAAAEITVRADTGERTLPVTLSLCQTDPATSVCINPMAPSTSPVIVDVLSGATPTFAVFATAKSAIPFDPANSRVFLYFSDDQGVVRGATSVAIKN